MKIEASSVSMGASRIYQSETKLKQASITRYYGDAGLERASVNVTESQISQKTMEASGAVYDTYNASAGVTEQEGAQSNQSKYTPINNGATGNAARQSSFTQQQQDLANLAKLQNEQKDWLSELKDKIDNDPKVQMLRKCLELLEKITGKKSSFSSSLDRMRDSLSSAYHKQVSSLEAQASVSWVSAKYQKTMLAAGDNTFQLSSSGIANGQWIRTQQVMQSGVTTGTENTVFSSIGTAVTSDGRTIDFNINMEMSREFCEAFEVVGKEEIYTDPLVINLDTDAASLSNVTFSFDLNCDGKAETLSGLDSSSGFLALDKNGDGKINDGSELFGAQSGDGFGDLAQYDQDGNGWIDENDDVFSKLSVWVQCGDGESKMLSLKDANVGAIFLGSQSTQFTLTNKAEENAAVVRRTGMYLKETGEAGTVQHLDFKT